MGVIHFAYPTILVAPPPPQISFQSWNFQGTLFFIAFSILDLLKKQKQRKEKKSARFFPNPISITNIIWSLKVKQIGSFLYDNSRAPAYVKIQLARYLFFIYIYLDFLP